MALCGNAEPKLLQCSHCVTVQVVQLGQTAGIGICLASLGPFCGNSFGGSHGAALRGLVLRIGI